MRALLWILLASCSQPPASSPDAQAPDAVPDSSVSDAPVPPVDAFYPTAPVATFPDPTARHPDVTLHAPATYDAQRAYPLIVFLHGYNGSAAPYAGWTPIQAQDVLYVVPIGHVDSYRQHYWNASAACCNRDHDPASDVAYLGDLIDRVIAAGWHVDRSRVVVVGASNGGFMAERLACDRSDVVTEIVDLSGAGPRADEPCTPSLPVAALVDHSHGDPTIQWGGGQIFGLPAYPPAAGAGGTADRGGCQLAATGATYDHDPATAGAETTESAGPCARGELTLWEEPSSGHVFAPTAAWGADVWTWIQTHPRA